MEAMWLFALLVFGIVAVPGVDMAFVLSSTLADGRRGGVAALAGIVAGGVVHVAMGMLGLGLLVREVPAAFNALLVAGALYVAWIGISLWREPASLERVEAGASRAAARTFLQGLTTCLLNPKAYVFMIAVFPQFIRPEPGTLWAQALALGAITALAQVTVYGGVALAAVRLRRGLGGTRAAQHVLVRGVALVLVGTAVWGLWNGWQGTGT